MAKLALLFAAFAVLLLVTNASIYRIDIDEENLGTRGRGDCQEQIQRQQQLRNCQEYIRQQAQSQRRGGRRYADEVEDMDNYYSHRQQGDVQQCCRQLESLDTQCRCRGLEQAIQQAQRQHRQSSQRQEARELYDVARDVPSMCRLQPMQCHFGQRY